MSFKINKQKEEKEEIRPKSRYEFCFKMRLTLCRFMPGVTKNKVRRPRRFNLFFSNKWHVQSELTVKDEGYRAACESKGIRVYSPEVLFSFLY